MPSRGRCGGVVRPLQEEGTFFQSDPPVAIITGILGRVLDDGSFTFTLSWSFWRCEGTICALESNTSVALIEGNRELTEESHPQHGSRTISKRDQRFLDSVTADGQRFCDTQLPQGHRAHLWAPSEHLRGIRYAREVSHERIG